MSEKKNNNPKVSDEELFNFILVSKEVGKANSVSPVYHFLSPELRAMVEKTFDTDIEFNKDHLT